ncbi:MAG TPA: AI-2E family transporter [Anaerolineae bacterium]
MKRVALVTALSLATILVVFLLWQFRTVVWLFVLSLAVAATVRPLVNRLIARKVPAGIALLAVYLIGIAALVALIVAVSQPIALEAQHVANDFTSTYENIVATWPKGSQLQRMISAQLPAANALLAQSSGSQGLNLAQTALGFTLSVVDMVSQAFLVLVLSMYWSADQVRFERLWLSLLQARNRVPARNIWRSVELGVGAYIRSEIWQSLLALLVLSVGYALIGVRYPMLLALVGAVFWFIPLVGGALVVAAALGVGLISGPLVALGTVLLTLAALAVLELVVEPRMFNRKQYNPILILLVMLGMTDAFGVFGLILGPPLAVAIQICLTVITNQVMPAAAGVMQPAMDPLAPQVVPIHDRLGMVRQLLSQMDSPSPRLLNMTERLEGLIKDLDHL